MRRAHPHEHRQRGVALIIVILVLFFMVTIGFALMAVTRSGPNIAGNIRWRQQALDAAEAGADASLKLISETIDDFGTQYRTTFNGLPGLDDPISTYYYRGLSDKQLVDDVTANADHFLYASQPLPDNANLTYTTFLIDGEAGAPTSSSSQAILVCIGHGPENTYVRIEVVLEME